jgi:hypothetical protein
MMPSSEDDVSGKSRLQNVIFFTGLALYVLSFFLPVFKDRVGSKSISGWRCAYAALFLWVVDLGPNTIPWLKVGYRLGGFGGIVNPIALAYIALCILDLARRMQRVLAALILLCILLTWASLVILCLQDADCPGLGHAVWVAGLLLMISAPFWKSFRQSL